MRDIGKQDIFGWTNDTQGIAVVTELSIMPPPGHSAALQYLHCAEYTIAICKSAIERCQASIGFTIDKVLDMHREYAAIL